jgi:hypothetical protein
LPILQVRFIDMSVPQATSIIDEAASVTASLLPEKSSSRYEHEYAEFKKWQKENVTGVTEDVVLAYRLRPLIECIFLNILR